MRVLARHAANAPFHQRLRATCIVHWGLCRPELSASDPLLTLRFVESGRQAWVDGLVDDTTLAKLTTNVTKIAS